MFLLDGVLVLAPSTLAMSTYVRFSREVRQSTAFTVIYVTMQKDPKNLIVKLVLKLAMSRSRLYRDS